MRFILSLLCLASSLIASSYEAEVVSVKENPQGEVLETQYINKSTQGYKIPFASNNWIGVDVLKPSDKNSFIIEDRTDFRGNRCLLKKIKNAKYSMFGESNCHQENDKILCKWNEPTKDKKFIKNDKNEKIIAGGWYLPENFNECRHGDQIYFDYELRIDNKLVFNDTFIIDLKHSNYN